MNIVHITLADGTLVTYRNANVYRDGEQTTVTVAYDNAEITGVFTGIECRGITESPRGA